MVSQTLVEAIAGKQAEGGGKTLLAMQAPVLDGWRRLPFDQLEFLRILFMLCDNLILQ
jgi:hypothetical protein